MIMIVLQDCPIEQLGHPAVLLRGVVRDDHVTTGQEGALSNIRLDNWGSSRRTRWREKPYYQPKLTSVCLHPWTDVLESSSGLSRNQFHQTKADLL